MFIGAVWCFTTLILINIYTSLLTSYIAAPGTQSLVKSVQELVERPDIWIVTDQNRNSESLMMVCIRLSIRLNSEFLIYFPLTKYSTTFIKSAKSGILKDLGDKLRMRPKSICKTPLQCANMVKSNPSCAYVAVINLYAIFLCVYIYNSNSDMLIRPEMVFYTKPWLMTFKRLKNVTWK